ncbi:AraC family transcriptional regulator [Arachidicoccus ginsenosidimutans]|uniref:AraC family transcriptional regulator n=1 Tax=Arachidicoccus sp. BS20 TaxID=1850526 RepID=UPI0007F121D0|nr:AraC family transcriptional regulator [Arachidicoccus sp. BS20]ANI90325.1 AraC family transcriptional regulator [Arachidicoccus sp. BS20]
MSKEKIPVYDICNLTKDKCITDDFLVERFHNYLKIHYAQLHYPHRHSFYHLVLFTKGNGFHTIDFQKFKVTPYQIYFMSPGQVHSWHFENNVEGYVINFSDTFFRSFLLSPNYLERFPFLTGNVAECCFRLPASIQQKTHALLEEMIKKNEQPDNDKDIFRILLLKLFLDIHSARATKEKKPVPQLKQQLLQSFKSLIDKHYSTLKLPKEYANLLHITPNHLNVLCNEMLGITAGKMIRDRQILEAKRLLINADMTITEIASMLNFEDNSYFNRFFKKSESITPNEFRKQLNNIQNL